MWSARWVTILYVWMGLMLTTQAQQKLAGSKECVVKQYCSTENAANALVDSGFGMVKAKAIEFANDSHEDSALRSCSCQDSCAYLGTCCADKKVTIPSALKKLQERLLSDPSSYTCERPLKIDLVVVTTCPANVAPGMKDRCETVLETQADRNLELKVTSVTSGLTYKNIYCGLCNGEKFEELESWSWNFDCSRLNSEESDREVLHSIADIVKSESCHLNNTVPSAPPRRPGGPMEIHEQIGVYADSLNLCDTPPIKTCPAGTDADTLNNCVRGSNNFILSDNNVYKNLDCLRCNEGKPAVQSAVCEACENEDNNCSHDVKYKPNYNLLNSFGVLVRPYPGGGSNNLLTCQSDDGPKCDSISSKLSRCGNGWFLNYKTAECERICPPNSYLIDGECRFIGFTQACDSNVSYSEFSQVAVSLNHQHILDQHTFLVVGQRPNKCYQCSYLVKSHDLDTIQVQNNMVFYNGEQIGSNFIFPINSSNGSYFVCLDQNHVIEEVVTIILLSISILSLVIYFTAFILFKRLRNVPGKIVAANMLCLLMAYIFFFLRIAVDEDTTPCSIIAILIHYFFLASFMFNIIYASFIVHSLEFIDFESSVNHWTAIRMWILGLLAPFLIIIPALIMDTLTTNPYRPEYGGKECFIMNHYGRYIYFIGPIGLCLLVAVILYLVILIKLVQIAKATSQVRSNHKEKVAIAMKLVVVLGFNWIFAVLAAATEHPIMVMVFIATCTLQGFFGFLVFICNKATLKDIKKFCVRKGVLQLEMTSTASKNVSTSGTASTDLTKGLLRRNGDSPRLP